MSNARNLANLLGTDTKVQTADIADAAFQANKNLIINGAMTVAQRGTSATGVSGYIAVDRFRTTQAAGFDELALTHEQSTDAPTGFSNSYKITVSTPETALAADELLRLEQRLEGQNLQHLKKGTSDAEAVTLSFWVKGSVTGTYTVNIFDQDNTRAIAKSYTINSANTWEYKTITFAGDTTGALDSDNAHSVTVAWNLAAGTDRTSGTLATSWEANTAANLAVGQTDIVTTSGATWQITGAQLEVGETATPFEHRSYGEELALCHRYFNQINGASGGFNHIGTGVMGVYNSTTQGLLRYVFPTEMRAAPTITFSALSTYDIEPFDVAPSAIASGGGTTKAGVLNVTDPSARTKGFAMMLTIDVTTGYIKFDSEL